MKKRLRTLTIDRTKWGRNNSAGELSGGALRQNDKSSPSNIGKMCCLGFACSKLGVTDKQMTTLTDFKLIGLPNDLSKSEKEKLPKWLFGEGDDVDKLASVNDNCLLSDTQKEKRIITIFARHGVKVKFIN